jgi:hypothetical protein
MMDWEGEGQFWRSREESTERTVVVAWMPACRVLSTVYGAGPAAEAEDIYET